MIHSFNQSFVHSIIQFLNICAGYNSVVVSNCFTFYPCLKNKYKKEYEYNLHMLPNMLLRPLASTITIAAFTYSRLNLTYRPPRLQPLLTINPFSFSTLSYSHLQLQPPSAATAVGYRNFFADYWFFDGFLSGEICLLE